MEGFVVFDYEDRYPRAMTETSQWMREGSLKSRGDIVEGLEKFPEALQMLFKGQNFGKPVLQVEQED